MNRWYYLKKGQAQGPVSIDEIRDGLRVRRFGPFDLIYREGDSKWKPLAEFDEFREDLARQQTPEEDDQWIILQRKPREAGKGFDQKGPFSTEEVRALIRTGEVRFHDYVWKEGMKEWYKVASIEAFVRPKPKRVAFDLPKPPPPPDSPGETLLVNVATLKQRAAAQAESKPPEAEGPNLAAKGGAGPVTGAESGVSDEVDEVTSVDASPDFLKPLASAEDSPPSLDKVSQTASSLLIPSAKKTVELVRPEVSKVEEPRTPVSTDPDDPENDIETSPFLSRSSVDAVDAGKDEPTDGGRQTLAGTVSFSARLAAKAVESETRAGSAGRDDKTDPVYREKTDPVYSAKTDPVFSAKTDPVYSAKADPAFAGKTDPIIGGERTGPIAGSAGAPTSFQFVAAEALEARSTDAPKSSVVTVKAGESPYRKERRKKQKGARSAVRSNSWVEEFKGFSKKSGVNGWRYFLHLVIIGNFLLIVGFIVLISSYRDQYRIDRLDPIPDTKSGVKVAEKAPEPARAPSPEPAPDAAANPTVTSSPRTPAPGPSAAPSGAPQPVAAKGPTPPTFLRVILRNMNSESPQILFNTDASQEYLIKVKVKAEPGEILANPSFYREYAFKAGPNVKLDLKAEGLPEGAYRLEANLENLTRERDFFVGQNDKDFKAKLARHRKGLAFYHQSEKYALYVLARRFEAEMKGVGAKAGSGRSFVREWQRASKGLDHPNLKRISARSASRFVYPFLWMELSDLKQQANELVEKMAGGTPPVSEWSSLEARVRELKLRSLSLNLY